MWFFFEVLGFGGLGFGVWNLRFEFWGFGFRVQGLGFMDSAHNHPCEEAGNNFPVHTKQAKFAAVVQPY